MRLFCTEIRAQRASDGEMRTYAGPNIPAPTEELAQQWCDENQGYLKVIGELIAEIPCDPGTYKPDFSNMVDYEKISGN